MQLHVNNSARRPRQPDASGQYQAPIQFRVAALDAELVTQADGAGKPGDLGDAVSPGESAVKDQCSFKCKAIRAKRHHGNDQVGSNTKEHPPKAQPLNTTPFKAQVIARRLAREEGNRESRRACCGTECT